MKINELEIVTVNYQTADLIEQLLTSRDCFGYSSIPVRVVDNSEDIMHQNQLDKMLIKFSNVTLDRVGKNIHHGEGLDRGIRASDKDFVLCLDSDTFFTEKGCITEFKELMTEGVDFVASVCYVNEHGIAIGATYSKEYPYKYPHPSLCLVRRESYLQSPFKFVTHGAPSIEIAIGYKKAKMEDAIVSYDGYGKHFSTVGRGTVTRFGYRYDKVDKAYYNPKMKDIDVEIEQFKTLRDQKIKTINII